MRFAIGHRDEEFTVSLSRRHFLGGLGATALYSSLLHAGRARAQAAAFPKRLILMFSPDGTIPSQWGATGTRFDFKLNRILKPLEPHQSSLIVTSGIDMASAYSGPGDGHQQGMGHLFTGVELLPGTIRGGDPTLAGASFSSGISVDQEVANKIGADNRFRSVELGVLVRAEEDTWTRMSSRGSNQPLPPENDPARVFARVFGSLGTDPTGEEKRRALRQSVLDFVHSEFATARKRVGKDAQQKLERHEDQLRDLENRLQSPTTIGATCTQPVLGTTLDARNPANAPALGKLQTDLLVMALACDLTRVGSIMWTNSVGNITYPWLGINDRHHDLSHEPDSNADAQEKLVRINTWYAEQLAYLLSRLSAVPEGDGTLLDNTLVVWGNELGRGNAHTRDDIPFLLAGKAGGSVRTGQYLKFDKRPHNDLLTSMCRAVGLDNQSFGDARFNTGPIMEIFG
jgi:hypothetical protein